MSRKLPYRLPYREKRKSACNFFFVQNLRDSSSSTLQIAPKNPYFAFESRRLAPHGDTHDRNSWPHVYVPLKYEGTWCASNAPKTPSNFFWREPFQNLIRPFSASSKLDPRATLQSPQVNPSRCSAMHNHSLRWLAVHHFADNLSGALFVFGQNEQFGVAAIAVQPAMNPVFVQRGQ
jgi:hypothetical protein